MKNFFAQFQSIGCSQQDEEIRYGYLMFRNESEEDILGNRNQGMVVEGITYRSMHSNVSIINSYLTMINYLY